MLHTNPAPLVSILLLAYRQEKFVREAVEAVLSQTYSPLEIIISDDASPDRTYEIMAETVAGYEGPHLIVMNRNESNLGLCAHLKKIVAMASGEWLVPAAGDDISEHNRCEKLVAAARSQDGILLVSSGWYEMTEDGVRSEAPLPKRFADGRIDSWGDYIWCDRFIRGNDIGIHGATCMWSKQLFGRFGEIANDVPAEDAVLSFRAYIAGGVAHIPDRLVRYRRHSSNLCGSVHADREVAEKKALEFEKRNCATLRQMREDFTKYRDLLDDSEAIRNISACLGWLTYRHETHVEWGSRGVIWRFVRMFGCLCRANKTEFMWCLRRFLIKRDNIISLTDSKTLK